MKYKVTYEVTRMHIVELEADNESDADIAAEELPLATIEATGIEGKTDVQIESIEEAE